jgi:ectoine hydroxylase-related dioxygenase (phytanoyl-CoA dioxygenase family)
MTAPTETAARQLSQQDLERYRRDGFLRVRGVLDAAEVARFREAARAVFERRAAGPTPDEAYYRVFTQVVNVWQEDPTLRELTLHPGLAHLAQQLAGVPVRLWHDHLLVKAPHNAAATEFHQDRPYWPHATSRHSLSAWVALVDVPPERGCMTFLPGSHERTDLRQQDLTDAGDLFAADPELRWNERVTVPLRAGDCTFHHSYTAHMALPNATDEPRLAHVNIYMDAETTFTGRQHPVTDVALPEVGARLEGPLFPAF